MPSYYDVPSLYEKQDIYPTIVKLFNANGKMLLKLFGRRTLVELSVLVKEEHVEEYRKLIAARKNNKVEKGKISIEKILRPDSKPRYQLVGVIEIKNLAVIGAVVNPFCNQFLYIFRKGQGAEIPEETTEPRLVDSSITDEDLQYLQEFYKDSDEED